MEVDISSWLHHFSQSAVCNNISWFNPANTEYGNIKEIWRGKICYLPPKMEIDISSWLHHYSQSAVCNHISGFNPANTEYSNIYRKNELWKYTAFRPRWKLNSLFDCHITPNQQFILIISGFNAAITEHGNIYRKYELIKYATFCPRWELTSLLDWHITPNQQFVIISLGSILPILNMAIYI